MTYFEVLDLARDGLVLKRAMLECDLESAEASTLPGAERHIKNVRADLADINSKLDDIKAMMEAERRGLVG